MLKFSLLNSFLEDIVSFPPLDLSKVTHLSNTVFLDPVKNALASSESGLFQGLKKSVHTAFLPFALAGRA
jgi:hypothetical protein